MTEFDSETAFQLRLIQVFVHELVHFVSSDEDETEAITMNILLPLKNQIKVF